MDFVVDRVDQNLDRFGESFPSASSQTLKYSETDPFQGWTPAFWTGLVWLAYETTGSDHFFRVAERHLDLFEHRLEEGDTNTHDLGFLYTLSAVPAYRHGDDRARRVILDAADELLSQYREDHGFIQHEGDPADHTHESYRRFIIDGLMNLPLLHWATTITGGGDYADPAETHAITTADLLVREDGSTFQAARVDEGEVTRETIQGRSVESCWARGQAWGIYGFALAHHNTGNSRFLDLARKLADYFLHNTSGNNVPYWDLDFGDTEGLDEPLDTSVAAIATCGFHELANQLPPPTNKLYMDAATTTLHSLSSNYTTSNTSSDGVLTQGVYNKPLSKGVSECCLWGDYFYAEGLVRLLLDWQPYWRADG